MRRSSELLTQTKGAYSLILCAFAALTALSWPILFSFDLWVLKDRGNLLNLDYLVSNNLRPGVDTFYSYALIPVALQHLLFRLFGRGYWLLIGCTVVTMLLMAAFWALLLRHLPKGRIWLLSVIAMSPILLWVNPNLPYSIVQLSLLFALLFVLKGRLDIALAIAAVGCLSVPSLPLVLASCLVVAILVDWALRRPTSSFRQLAAQLAPGAITYLLLSALLTAFFGIQSVLVTGIPLLGAKFYQAVGFNPIDTSLEFLHPPGHSALYYVGYYLGTPATWWFLSTFLLFFMAARSTIEMLRRRQLDPKNLFVVFSGVLQLLFTFVARGPLDQYIIYDPILVAGVLVGISLISVERRRKQLLLAFVALALLAEAAQLRSTILAWRSTSPAAATAHLYATQTMVSEWSQIVSLAADHRLLLLSYGTGAHHYFPNVQTGDVWTLRSGQLFPSDIDRLHRKLQQAQVVVEDRTGLTATFDKDPLIQEQLAAMCLTNASADFYIWQTQTTVGENIHCLPNPKILQTQRKP